MADFPFGRQVRGRDGRTLAEHWGRSPKAHLGTTGNGFSNLLLLQGPDTGLGHTSVLLMQEAQYEHLVKAVRHMDQHGITTVEPTAEAQMAFVAGVDGRGAEFGALARHTSAISSSGLGVPSRGVSVPVRPTV